MKDYLSEDMKIPNYHFDMIYFSVREELIKYLKYI